MGGGGGWRRALKGDKARGRPVSGEGLLFFFFSVSVCIALHCVALRCDFLFIFILYFFSCLDFRIYSPRGWLVGFGPSEALKRIMIRGALNRLSVSLESMTPSLHTYARCVCHYVGTRTPRVCAPLCTYIHPTYVCCKAFVGKSRLEGRRVNSIRFFFFVALPR